jgi:transcriptional regulator with XRE-family HTH domain
MTDSVRTKIGQKLKAAREYLGYSQEEVAEKLGVARAAISLIESGQRKLDSVELMELSKLYERPMAYFTEDDFSIELGEEAAVFARNYSELSAEDQKELFQFAEYLASRSESRDEQE